MRGSLKDAWRQEIVDVREGGIKKEKVRKQCGNVNVLKKKQGRKKAYVAPSKPKKIVGNRPIIRQTDGHAFTESLRRN